MGEGGHVTGMRVWKLIPIGAIFAHGLAYTTHKTHTHKSHTHTHTHTHTTHTHAHTHTTHTHYYVSFEPYQFFLGHF
jgi:hypothetical protein